MIVRRGDIYWGSLDPAVGAEIKKIRPCIVVSNDVSNTFSPVVTVAPISTQKLNKIYPHEVRIEDVSHLKNGKVKMDHLRSIDKRRLGKFITKAPAKLMKKVDVAIALHLGLGLES